MRIYSMTTCGRSTTLASSCDGESTSVAKFPLAWLPELPVKPVTVTAATPFPHDHILQLKLVASR